MASISTAVMPTATVILAWIILGEQLTKMEFTGMALVISSTRTYLSQSAVRRKKSIF